MMPKTCSKRTLTSLISRIFCFSLSLSVMCAAIVSASRPASWIPEREVKISGGTFLFNFTYCSNWAMIERTNTLISRSSSCSSSSRIVIAAEKWSSMYSLLTCARSPPSTSTLTVPSGSLRSCRIVASVPTSCRSSGFGSSRSAVCWAISKIFLLAFMAKPRATIDFSRPTKSGITMCG